MKPVDYYSYNNGCTCLIGIYYFECGIEPEVFGSIFHSLRWAVATLTTVSYGDVYPVMIGLGIIAVPTALIASALTKIAESDE